MDRVWWDKYIAQARAEFSGRRYTYGSNIYDLLPSGVHHYQNSGAGAIALAAAWRPRRIILLGYDCRHTGGKAHWHGDHPKGLKNAGTVGEWPEQFAKLKRFLQMNKPPEIINATPGSRLQLWPKLPLSEALCVP